MQTEIYASTAMQDKLKCSDVPSKWLRQCLPSFLLLDRVHHNFLVASLVHDAFGAHLWRLRVEADPSALVAGWR